MRPNDLLYMLALQIEALRLSCRGKAALKVSEYIPLNTNYHYPVRTQTVSGHCSYAIANAQAQVASLNEQLRLERSERRDGARARAALLAQVCGDAGAQLRAAIDEVRTAKFVMPPLSSWSPWAIC